ncbi:hypothetical protein E2C01_093517 [Portunus trituberculatus]|uniref:Uncharacterized protein n=1 Tax=Portunus trituberculatus TaxID=210409 RepID=A0A5B7K0N1_PORTR|nr:hypothetical protein [Portunus trituberculatus]
MILCLSPLLCHLSNVLQVVIKCLLRIPLDHRGISHYTKWEIFNSSILVKSIFITEHFLNNNELYLFHH